MKGEGYIVCRANGWDPEPPRCIGMSEIFILLMHDYIL